MLDPKKIRMLELLDEMMWCCKNCNLYTGGRVTPYWTSLSKYVIIGEAPGREEVENNEPFIGKSGRLLCESMAEFGFRKEEFLIVNCVQCRPTDGNKNLKPNTNQIETCKLLWQKYIKVLKPYKILTLGNYAMGNVHVYSHGITSRNARYGYTNSFGDEQGVLYVNSIHPSYCIYNKEQGPRMLRESIKVFRKGR